MKNWLELVTAAVLLLLVLSGFRKGFVRKLASMVSFVISIVLVSLLLPHMTEFLKNETPVFEYIAEQCGQTISAQIDAFEADHPLSGANPETLTSGRGSANAQQEAVIEALPLPEMLKTQLGKHNNREGYLSLNASTFQDYIINYVATVILNVIAFLLAVILVQLALRLAIQALDLLAHFPVIGFVNRLAGGALGLLQGLFLLWLFFLVLSMFQSAEIGQQMMEMVQDSAFLAFMYESNLFMQIVLGTAAVFAA